MINNNRQQNGRRRGRGGGSGGGGGGGQRSGNPGRPEMGNRIDNRARGNAAQLLEKYKSLARDAQMQGDRVNTEYYLQFADHYFRVLSESRARFEETRRPNDDNGFDNEDDFDGDDGDMRADQQQDRGQQDRPQQQDRQQQRDRDDRGGDRSERRPDRQQAEGRRSGYNDNARGDGESRGETRAEPRRERFDRDGDDAPQEGVAATEGDPVREAAPRRLRRPRAEAEAESVGSGLDAAMLPPALGIGNDVAADAEGEDRPRPRRRGRPPASDIAEAS